MTSSMVTTLWRENTTALIVGVVVVPLAAVLYSLVSSYASTRPYRHFPVASTDGLSPKDSWYQAGSKTIAAGLENNAPFQVITGTGPRIVLPNRYADEVGRLPNLSLSQAFQKDYMINLPGFEPFATLNRDDHFLPEIVRTKLNQSLGIISPDLVEETALAVEERLGDDTEETHTIVLRTEINYLVNRIISRVFLGPTLCRNESWLELTERYSTNAVVANKILRKSPHWARRFVNWMLPSGRKARQDLRDIYALLMPEVEKRKQRMREELEAGRKPPKQADFIGWMYETARERREDVDYVASQIGMNMAAMHGTTEALCQALVDVCVRPEVLSALRKEIIEVIGPKGWSSNARLKMRLLDSFLKESMRIHPHNELAINRKVLEETRLSDGTVLPKDAIVVVAAAHFDPTVYDNPNTFDAYRFVREGNKGNSQFTSQLVATNPNFLAFGLGKQQCPGRFFVAEMLKITMSYLLLKFDWSLVDGQIPERIKYETNIVFDGAAKLGVHRRKEEVDVGRSEF